MIDKVSNCLVVINDALVPLAGMLGQQLESRPRHVIARVLNGPIQRHAQILVYITSVFSTYTSHHEVTDGVAIIS